jgi:hypothetical protein
VAIMGGLGVATFLTLGNLPALYVLLFRVERPPAPPAPPAPHSGTDSRSEYATTAGLSVITLVSGPPTGRG